jgi:hypothetical protein
MRSSAVSSWCGECKHYHLPPMHYPALNVDLLDKTLDHVETIEAFVQAGLDVRDHFDMSVWAAPKVRPVTDIEDEWEVCGTRKCFAGWAIELSGVDHEWKSNPDAAVGADFDLFVDGEERDAEGVAAEVLGLTGDESTSLFYTGDLDDVREVVQAIKGGLFRKGV